MTFWSSLSFLEFDSAVRRDKARCSLWWGRWADAKNHYHMWSSSVLHLNPEINKYTLYRGSLSMFPSLTVLHGRTRTLYAKHNSIVQFQPCTFLSFSFFFFHLNTSGDESEHKRALNNVRGHVSGPCVHFWGTLESRSGLPSHRGIKSAIACFSAAVFSNVTSRQKVEGPVLAAVGRLELIPQAELPLVLQLQPDDGLTQGTSILADHAEGGACGRDGSKAKQTNKQKIKWKEKVRRAQQQHQK